MLKYCYNTNGLRTMPAQDAIRAVAYAGYEGVEISLHKVHLDPMNYVPTDIIAMGAAIRETGITPACLATGCADLLSEDPYEPCLISPSESAREQRVELIERCVPIAEELNIPVINFASGLIKPSVSHENAWAFLIKHCKQLLQHTSTSDVIFAIEPEPDMFIETTTQAISLLDEINDPRMRLNLDVGHVYCCQDDFFSAVEAALPYTVHIHIEDIHNRVHHHEIPGTGDIDFPRLLRLIEKSGYTGYVSVELYHHAKMYQQALTQSLSYLQKQSPELLYLEDK